MELTVQRLGVGKGADLQATAKKRNANPPGAPPEELGARGKRALMGKASEEREQRLWLPWISEKGRKPGMTRTEAGHIQASRW